MRWPQTPCRSRTFWLMTMALAWPFMAVGNNTERNVVESIKPGKKKPLGSSGEVKRNTTEPGRPLKGTSGTGNKKKTQKFASLQQQITVTENPIRSAAKICTDGTRKSRNSPSVSHSSVGGYPLVFSSDSALNIGTIVRAAATSQR